MKTKRSFWFEADKAAFYSAFNEELESRLKIIDEKIKTQGSVVQKCPMWSYISLSLAMLYLIALTIWTWFSPSMEVALASFIGSLIMLVIIAAIDYARKGR